MESYRPRDYWSTRLGRNFDLRGTGHVSYSLGYNAWMYRAKRRALRAAVRDLRPPLEALDVGSGTGWCVAELVRLGADVEGCDLTDVSISQLAERFEEASFFTLELGAETIPRDDSRYDLITALDVIYHITSDERFESAVAELARVLRPGGRLVVTDALGSTDREPAAHVRFRSVGRWRTVCEAHGLVLRDTRPLYRWLSRDRERGALARLPDTVRGGIEYALESVWRREPHMRCAVIEPASASE